MNDNEQRNLDSSLFTPVVGFALGALVGAGIALLFAPASGERTRRRLGNAARRVSREARHTFDEARETVSGLGADVKSAVDAGREVFQHDGKASDAPLPSRIAQALNPPPRSL